MRPAPSSADPAGWARIAGHRGAAGLAPENTLAGLRAAAAAGCRGVEFDVMLSGDEQPLLIHDETLDRTTDGRGAVADHAAAHLARLDAGGWFDPRYAGERIPTLGQAAALARALGLWCNLEIKPSRGREALTGRIAARAALELWPGGDGLLVSSFSEAALAAAAGVAPALARGLLFEQAPEDWPARLARLGCCALHLSERAATAELLAAAWAREVPLVVYTVNDPARAATLLAAGVRCVITDRPDRVRAAEVSGRPDRMG